MLMSDFYTYRYIRLDTNTPFYVGKGKGRRASNISSHNNICKNIAKKHGYIIEYIIENTTEKIAFAKEIEFISMYKNLGYCEANLTGGGEGISGFNHSLKTKKKISRSHSGKTLTKEHKEKLSIAHVGKTLTKEHKEKLSKANQISQNKPLHKKKLSKTLKNRWKNKEFKEKMSKIQKEIKNKPEFKAFMAKITKENKLKEHEKPFNVYIAVGERGNKNKGKWVGSWSNKITCIFDLNLNKNDDSNISSVLKGKRKTCKNYIFEYIKESQ
jgi:hypothetical protein